jgi:hypothetical protein
VTDGTSATVVLDVRGKRPGRAFGTIVAGGAVDGIGIVGLRGNPFATVRRCATGADDHV